MAINRIEPVTLKAYGVTLEPLAQRHHADLVVATRDGELWKLWYTSVPGPDTMAAEIEQRLARQAAGEMLPFAVIDNARGAAVGMTSYCNIEPAHRRLEIGYTWYRTAVQNTSLNTAAKRLLLGHAFEELDAVAVEFRTHILNERSRRAIERLGAKLDGILRNHRIMPNGTLRDTCVYSILAGEWPTVRTNLDFRLSAGLSQ